MLKKIILLNLCWYQSIKATFTSFSHTTYCALTLYTRATLCALTLYTPAIAQHGFQSIMPATESARPRP